jgi:dolichyl-phosphate-mannose--protein O-mannosyl transferase
MARKRASKEEEFLASLADGSLYSMGAFFSDQHPELVEEVIAQAEGIEQRGLRGYAEEAGMSVEEAYETLMTGLAVRYYNAVAG